MCENYKKKLTFAIRLYLAGLLLLCAGLLFYACFYYDRVGILLPCHVQNVSNVTHNNQTATFKILLITRNQTILTTDSPCNGTCLDYLDRPVYCWGSLDGSIHVLLTQPNLRSYDANYRANVGCMFLLLLVTIPMIVYIALCGWPGSKSKALLNLNDKFYDTL
jgi:hypothetical protein